MQIQVLGPGCARCKATEARVREVLQELGLEANVEKVTAVDEMIELGVFQTPGLIIDGQIKAVGRIPKLDEIRGWLGAYVG